MAHTLSKKELSLLPQAIRSYVEGAACFKRSSSHARVLFLDKGEGYFLKSAQAGALKTEAVMAEYFHKRGLGPRVVEYATGNADHLLTARLAGDNGISPRYLAEPKRLCESFAGSLRALHAADVSDCPVPNRSADMFGRARRSQFCGLYDAALLAYMGYNDAGAAFNELCGLMPAARDDALIHGDYCLPNVILSDWRLGGFVDLGGAGVGDRHCDLFWGLWTLRYNLKTDVYGDRFLDCYGRERVDAERLKLCGLLSVFSG